MTSYVVVQLAVKDPAKFGAYREKAGEALAKHGGAVIAGGPDAETLEDTGASETMLALLQFPSPEAARSWIGDPELTDVHALRRAGADTTIKLLPALG